MSFNWDRALQKANDLEDDNLSAALQLADGDGRWEALLRPPEVPQTEVPLNEGSQRHVMCPDLYRAALSGSISHVDQLLGLADEIPHTNDECHDVEIQFEDIFESNGSHKQLGARVHGYGSCTLQEVTAEKNTMLHIAAEQGHLELVKHLIRNDSALLTSQNSRQETPLLLAARAGNHHVISLIVFLAQESGVGAHEVLMKRSTDGDTVLHEAARHGHEDVVQVLMAVAPALSAEVNNAFMSPLYLAVFRKSIGVVKALLEYSHLSSIGPNQQNALHAAVLVSQEITSMLLDWKSELAYGKDASGSTPLHYAASNGDITVVRNILNKAPLTVYIRDQEGSSPLHAASRMHHYSVISSIIDHCPDSFELRDNQGRNFLHIVAQHVGTETHNRQGLKNLNLIIKLVSQRPDLKSLVNERDNEGNTPLHFASMKGFSEVLSHLLKACKADTTQMNNDGKTALDNAISLSSFSLMAGTTVTLSAYGAKFSPQRQDKLKNWKDEATKWIDRTSTNLIIVSVLIATIAFSAAFNVPGSYNGDGVANLRKKIQYNIFVVLDTIALSASVSATMLLVVAKAVSKWGSWISFTYSLIFLWISLFTMQLAFVLAVSVALGEGQYATKSIIGVISFHFFSYTVATIYKVCFPAKLRTIRKFLSSMKEQTETTRQIDVQFPMLTSYVSRSNLFFFINLFFFFTMTIILWVASILDYRPRTDQ
ncbi:Ankyrin repeat family protein-like [Rhynchospora pubera]|uniref:Ankyrin repeat family protein-like n=1 Tax=Rhynchospora pubera TaxID=906938 RepID=A0AAV8G8C5_9POAL|nr:Ankyrin repeat family protein-like [Rhynchospora pubera]